MKQSTSLSFSEVMRGYLAFGEVDAARGAAVGRAEHTRLTLRLTIEIPDFERFASDPREQARVTGSISCDALGGSLPVEQGWFNLFVDAAEHASMLMAYRLFARDSIGHPITLSGVKRARGVGWRGVWPDTTTLFTQLLAGHVPAPNEAGADVIAAGIVAIRPLDFVRQLTTLRAHGPARDAGAPALFRFGVFFAQHVWRAEHSAMRRTDPDMQSLYRTDIEHGA